MYKFCISALNSDMLILTRYQQAAIFFYLNIINKECRKFKI